MQLLSLQAAQPTNDTIRTEPKFSLSFEHYFFMFFFLFFLGNVLQHTKTTNSFYRCQTTKTRPNLKSNKRILNFLFVVCCIGVFRLSDGKPKMLRFLPWQAEVLTGSTNITLRLKNCICTYLSCFSVCFGVSVITLELADFEQ